MAVRAFGARDDGKAKSDAERASVFLFDSRGGVARRRGEEETRAVEARGGRGRDTLSFSLKNELNLATSLSQPTHHHITAATPTRRASPFDAATSSALDRRHGESFLAPLVAIWPASRARRMRGATTHRNARNAAATAAKTICAAGRNGVPTLALIVPSAANFDPNRREGIIRE